MPNKLAVVRVRGIIGFDEGLKRTFKQINLLNKNWCVIIEDGKVARGMLQKLKDYVTWGEIDEATMKELVGKRGEPFISRTEDSKKLIKYKKYFEHDGKKYKKQFRLSPPKKGYGRKGVKNPFTDGGALGYRAEKINELLKRMI